MATLWMEYGIDFALNPYGGLQMAYGWDETRQVLERTAFTQPQLTLPDGSVMPPEYYLDGTFGLGLRQKVGSNPTPQSLTDIQSGLTQAAAASPGVDPTQSPTFLVSQEQHTVYIQQTVPLNNGTSQTLTYVVTGSTPGKSS